MWTNDHTGHGMHRLDSYFTDCFAPLSYKPLCAGRCASKAKPICGRRQLDGKGQGYTNDEKSTWKSYCSHQRSRNRETKKNEEKTAKTRKKNGQPVISLINPCWMTWVNVWLNRFCWLSLIKMAFFPVCAGAKQTEIHWQNVGTQPHTHWNNREKCESDDEKKQQQIEYHVFSDTNWARER